jgi:hypothetical protein
MEAAQAHFLEHVDLTAELVLLQVAVPSPERGAAVFGGGVFEQFTVEGGLFPILIVDHVYLLFSAVSGIKFLEEIS